MKTTVMVALVVMFLWAAPAKAWNCSNPLSERVLVPAGTAGTYGDGDGQLANFNGQLYECEVVNPNPPSTGSNTNSNQNTNTSNSSSTAKSTASAAGGAGGSVSGSGNSTNTITNTANGGSASQHQGQSQSTNSSAVASGNGNNSNNYSENIPQQVETAVAPTILPTVPCFKGYSGAAQTTAFGFSFGAGKIDAGCDARETARSFAGIGNRSAAARILCNQNAAKKAGLTLDDCLSFVVPVQVNSAVPTQVSPAPITVNVPALAPITVNVPEPQVVIIPGPVVPPPPSIVVAANTVKKVHKPSKPCPVITNENIQSSKILQK